MGRLVIGDCGWCGEKSLKGNKNDPQEEDQVRLLLSLLALSPSIVAEEEATRLCSNCNDLVYAGIDYRKRLDEAKLTLENRAVSGIVKSSESRGRKTKGDASPRSLSLGQRIAKCFLNCSVQLENVNLEELASLSFVEIPSESGKKQAVEFTRVTGAQEAHGPELELEVEVKVETNLAQLVSDENGENILVSINSNAAADRIPEMLNTAVDGENGGINYERDHETEDIVLQDEWMEIDNIEPLESEEFGRDENLQRSKILVAEDALGLVNTGEEQVEAGHGRKNGDRLEAARKQSKLKNKPELDENVESDEDFSVQDLSSNGESSAGDDNANDDDDPSFHPQSPDLTTSRKGQQPTRRHTRASASACNDTSSTTLQDFVIPLNSHLGFEAPVKCPVCTHVSQSKVTHREHVSKAHNLGCTMMNYYHCYKCQEPWKSRIAKRGQGELRDDDKDSSDFMIFVDLHAKCKNEPLTNFKCKFCDWEASTFKQLCSHEIKKHTRSYPFHCEYCDDGFFMERALESHLKLEEKYSKTKPYSCDQCDKSFATRYLLRRHKTAHHHEQMEPEPEDQVDPEEALAHICTECGKVLQSLYSLATHIRTHDEQKKGAGRCVCEICGKVLAISSLRSHRCLAARGPSRRRTRKAAEREGGPSEKKSKSGKKPGSHLCAECGKVFPRSVTLKYHMNSHTGNRPFRCAQCDKAFPSPQLLNKHKRHHRDKSKKGNFPCPQCGKLFFRDVDVESHIRCTHNSEVWKGPFICSICEKVYQTAYELKYHMNYHTGNRPYKCTECDKAFTRPEKLQIHKRTHQENRERNVPCPRCDKMFFNKSNVIQHVRVFHNKLPWPSKIKTYKKWIPKNPEALEAAGIEYKQKLQTGPEAESETVTGERESSSASFLGVGWIHGSGTV